MPLPLPTTPVRSNFPATDSRPAANARPASIAGGIPTPARYRLASNRPESVGSATLLNGGGLGAAGGAGSFASGRSTPGADGAVGGRGAQQYQPGIYGGGSGPRESSVPRPGSSVSTIGGGGGGRASPLPSGVSPLSPPLSYSSRPQSSLSSYTTARSGATTPTASNIERPFNRTRSSSIAGSEIFDANPSLGPAVGNGNSICLGPIVKATPITMGGKPDEPTNIKVIIRIRPSANQTLDASLPQRLKRVVLSTNGDNPSECKDVFVQTAPSSASSTNPDLPPSTSIASSASVSSTPTVPGSSSASASGKTITFTYDRVLSERASQEDAYEVAGRGAVTRFLEGYNACLLAYGQTSSGKSYTMGTTGLAEDYLPVSAQTTRSDAEAAAREERMGIIPRAVKDVFAGLEAMMGENEKSVVKVSFLELYQEELIDLLSNAPNGMSNNITLREDKDGRTLVFGMHEVVARSPEDVLRCLEEGSRRRRVGRTDMNESSSRSHAILSLTLVQTKVVDATGVAGRQVRKVRSRSITRPVSTSVLAGYGRPGGTSPTKENHRASMLAPSAYKAVQATNGRASPSELSATREITSRFHFVDLAGSERLKRTGASNEQRVKEGISINGGLLSLSNVISALADPSKSGINFVPFRTSKLTRILKDSLGGDSHTVMIACASALEANLAETINTLKYASRAMKITNAVKLNTGTEIGWDDIDYLRGLVLNLRKRLSEDTVESAAGQLGDIKEGSGADVAQIRLDLEAANDAVRELTLRNARLMADLDSTQHDGETKDKDPAFLEAVGPIIDEYERIIEKAEEDLQRCRAELRICQELLDEQTSINSETAATLATQTVYVDELRKRIVKARENESATEEHLREVELECQKYMDAASIQEVRGDQQAKELAKLKETEIKVALYVAELEATLGQQGADQSQLTERLHGLEQVVLERDNAYQILASRLERSTGVGYSLDNPERAERSMSREAAERTMRLESEAGRVETPNGPQDLAALQKDGEDLDSPDSERRMAFSDQAKSIDTPPSSAFKERSHSASNPEARLRRAEERVKELEAILAEKENVFVLPNMATPPTPSKLSPRWRSTTQTNPYNTWSAGFRTGEGQGARPMLKRLSLSSGAFSPSLQGSSSPLRITKLSRQSLPALQMERSPTSYQSEIRQLQQSLNMREEELAQLEETVKAANLTSSAPSPPRENTKDQDQSVRDLTDEANGGVADDDQQSSPGDSGNVSEGSSADNRVASLMQAFAAKEASHGAELVALRKNIDQLEMELATTKQHRDQPSSGAHTENSLVYGAAEHDGRVDGAAVVSSTSLDKELQRASQSHELLSAQERLQEQLLSLHNELDTKASVLSDTRLMLSAATSEKLALEEQVNRLQQTSALRESQLADTKLSVEVLTQQREALTEQFGEIEGAATVQAQTIAALTAQLELANTEKTDLMARVEQLQQEIGSRANPVISPTTTVFPTRAPVASRVVSTPTQKGIPPIGPPPGMPPPPLPQLELSADGQKRLPGDGTMRRRPSMPNMKRDYVPPPVSPTAEKMLEQVRIKDEELKASAAKLQECQGDLKASMDLISNLESSLATSEKALRKARLQLTESSKEREDLDREVERLNEKISGVESEMSSVRHSVTVEKRSLEDRLSQEVRAKEVAKRQLEDRLTAAQQAKQSRFKCF